MRLFSRLLRVRVRTGEIFSAGIRRAECGSALTELSNQKALKNYRFQVGDLICTAISAYVVYHKRPGRATPLQIIVSSRMTRKLYS
jgi:hypothetical protein